jgi:predicted Zn-dependent peptidase
MPKAAAPMNAAEGTITGGAEVLKNHRLPGGAVLAVDPAEGARSFAAGFWFSIGSRHEKPRERGFSHFVEHMTFKGTSRRSAAQLSREIERVGGYINAFTDRDSLCIHCQVPAQQWRLALDILADMAFESVFDEEDFERERDVILSEILAARDDPEECAHDELLAAIWPDDPLSLKIAGEVKDIESAKRDDVEAFYRSNLAPDKLIITAAGPVPEADVAQELCRLLPADRKAGPSRTSNEPAFKAAQEYVDAATEQVAWFEALQLSPPFDEKDYFTLSALNGAIGEASSSRLFLNLRERKGLCYSVYSAFSMSKSECLWIASANTQVSQLAELSKAMDECLDEIAEEGLGEEECADAVTRLSGSLDLALDDTDFRMRRVARQILFSGQAMTVDEIKAQISALNAEDLNAFSGRLFKTVDGSNRPRARLAYGRRPRKAARSLGLEEAARRG